MEKYRYYVRTPAGKGKRGTITASDQQDAVRQLKMQGYFVIEVKAPGILETEIHLPSLTPRVKVREMGMFCRQFATLTEAGISIARALALLEEQTDNQLLRAAIHDVKASVEEGQSLAYGIKRQNKIFPSMLVNLVQAGEESGSLNISFERMAVHYEKTSSMQSTVRKAMIYPVILLVVSMIVVVLMLTFIVPMYTGMFEEMGAELPLFTRALVGVSGLFAEFWWMIGIVIVGMTAAVRGFGRTNYGHYLFDRIALGIPMIGTLKRKTACAQFARNFSTLLGAGVPILEALFITAEVLDSPVYKEAVKNAYEQVSQGVLLSAQLKESGLFPPMVYHMAGVGEETGKLDAMLQKTADYYEEEVAAGVSQAAAALEPIVIIVLSLIVMTIIAAVFTPMVSLYSNVDAF